MSLPQIYYFLRSRTKVKYCYVSLLFTSDFIGKKVDTICLIQLFTSKGEEVPEKLTK